jgi:monovalent cation:proton antiporter-2 (CPA2) family protein
MSLESSFFPIALNSFYGYISSMTLEIFLLGAFVYLAAAVVSAPLAKRLGLGSVLGFLVAGAVIGPSALGLVGTEGENVKNFGEFGVIVMLFLVGLELETSKLWALRKDIFGLGLAQVLCVSAAIALAALPFADFWQESLTIGLILAMSSTAIVLQNLQERGILKSPVGQSVFSVLLFQDISVIPILALLPLIATTEFAGGTDHGSTLISEFPAYIQAAIIMSVVAGIVVAGRFLLRPVFRIVADTGAREIFVAFALLLVVGITLLMGEIGLSPALGTFLAGVVLADSEYRHELEMDLQPFKGILLAIFFIAVGAGIDFTLLQSTPTLVMAGLVGFIAIKLAVQFGLARAFGKTGADQSRFGFSLAQGSEFGFVLIAFATGFGLLPGNSAALLTAIIALSMAAAPLLTIMDERLIQPRFADGDFMRDPDAISHDGVDAIIAGHGRFGMTIGRLLNAQGKRTVILDSDSSQVEALRKFGFKVFYGDALRLDLLEAAGAKDAKVLIIAIDDREKATELVRIAKQNFPNLKPLVRVYDRTHAYEILREGVDDVYREVYGSSMDMGQDALVALGLPRKDAQRVTALFRRHDEIFLRKAAEVSGDQNKLVDLARISRAEIAKVFANDKGSDGASGS